MTQRDKNMAKLLGIVVVVGGGLMGGLMFFRAISTASQDIEDLTFKKTESQAQVKKVRDFIPLLKQYRRLSLAGELHLAARVYRNDLLELFRKHEVQELTFNDEQPKSKSAATRSSYDTAEKKQIKAPLWTGINYQVRFKTKLANLVAFIKDFQNTPRMHRIKTLSIDRQDEKKDDMLQVSLTFEALSILDAEQYQQKAGINDVPGLQRVEAVDTLATLRNGPSSMALLGWMAGPKGAVVPPLNPPLTWVRKYGDIARKNLFMGFVQVSGSLYEGMDKAPPSDDDINTMRFNRFISLTDDEGKVEAMLWDASTNDKKRLKTAGGFNKFTMLQSGESPPSPVVDGVVVKIEPTEIVFRVALRASDPTSSKWWRYPIYNHFYNLHQDDFSTLAGQGKVKEPDRTNLYVVNQSYWEKLINKQVDLYPDGKTFRFVKDSMRGEIVYSDREVLIVRVNEWPPTPLGPSVSADRIYPKAKSIYHIQKNHLADLLADKALTGTKKLKADEMERVYVMRTPYWDLLAHQFVIHSDSSRGTFTFYKEPMVLIKGDVISRTEELVVFRVAEKYCHCAGDRDTGVKDRWHEGFCVLKIDRMAQDALLEPLAESRLAEFLKPVAAAAAGQ
jgi:hypothetical protein